LASPAQVLKSSKLTEKQKSDIEAKYITEKAGAMKLTKVAHTEKKDSTEMFADVIEQNVVQTDTNVVQSTPKSIFDEQPQPTIEDFDFF
jgi:acyl-ACP thioesterase